MEELILKYNMLDDLSKKKLMNYLEMLLLGRIAMGNQDSANNEGRYDKKESVEFNYESFRKNLLKLDFVWPESDVHIYEENKKLFNEWIPKEW